MTPLLKAYDLGLDDIDLWEINEAFASHADPRAAEAERPGQARARRRLMPFALPLGLGTWVHWAPSQCMMSDWAGDWLDAVVYPTAQMSLADRADMLVNRLL